MSCLLSLLKPNCYMRWLLLYLKSSLQILFWLPLKCDAPKWPVLGISLLVPGDLFQSTWLQPPSQAIMFPAPTLRCHIHFLCWQSPSDYPAGPLTQHSQIKTQSPSSNTDSPLAGYYPTHQPWCLRQNVQNHHGLLTTLLSLNLFNPHL